MKNSTKHAMAQRLLGLLGLILFAGPNWFKSLNFIPNPVQYFGLFVIFFANLSAFGVGKWGRHYSSLCVSEREEENRKLEPKQPWQR
jgi:hypothetical protein